MPHATAPVEAREHVRRFHELFFTLAPDKAAIESNINRAMYLADKSLYGYYRDWNEKGFYNRLISGNVNQTIVVDSMGCDFDSYPYRVTTYARQMIIRGSNVTERSLVTRCRLQSTVRSDNNPQVPCGAFRDSGKQGPAYRGKVTLPMVVNHLIAFSQWEQSQQSKKRRRLIWKVFQRNKNGASS
mgnify:CR=1 FL=1